MQRRTFVAAGGAALLHRAVLRPFAPPPLRLVADPTLWSASQAAAAIKAKRISAAELTRLTLERIDRFNPRLNAIVNVLRDSATARAREADAALAKGTSWGPLHGVPVTIKETFAVKGLRHTAGAKFLERNVAAEDAASTARFRKAGAIILGNTNVPFMAGDWQSYNDIYGQTGNPWDLGRSPGGSSGGSSAALAAGMGHLSIGSDIGGSIRIPAHFCGIYGHKPTVGVVPLRGHIPPVPGQDEAFLVELPVAGPMARSAADLALAMRVLGGPAADEAIAYRWTMPAARKTRLREFRVGYVLDDPACPVSTDSKDALSRAIESLRGAGVQLTEGWPEGISLGREFYSYQYLLWTYFTALATEDQPTLRARAARPDSSMTTVQARAWSDDFATLGKQIAARERARAVWAKWFETHDVFLSPTAFVPAFPHDHSPDQMARTIATSAGPRPYMDLVIWIGMATFTGCPATTAPVGSTAQGLPVGLQIMGPYLEDATPIAFAEALAGVVGGFRLPPGY